MTSSPAFASRAAFAGCVLAAAALPACSFIVDGALQDRLDAGPPEVDAGPPPTACTGRADGTFCDIEGLLDREICVAGDCVVSSCGDGYADTRTGHPSGIPPTELCDDGNDINGDGCDADCTYSCDTDADCPDDAETCNGVPFCDPTTHACTSVALADTTACFVVLDSPVDPPVDGTCRGGVCRSGTCGMFGVEPGEECDDGNLIDGDGCDADCTWTCQTDEECQDADVCNGVELCDLGTHTCSPQAAPDCDDGDPCTIDACDAVTGCSSTSMLVDADMDGFFAITPSCGGTDCDDMDATVNPRATEPCGATRDMNCDGVITMTTWYADCDNDTYAAAGAETMSACEQPTVAPSSCGGTGTWTALRPLTAGVSIDCRPTVNAAHPYQSGWYSSPITGTTSYDYDCSGATEWRYPTQPTLIFPCSGTFSCTGGTWYWDEVRPPSCGSTATLSYCATNWLGTCVRTTGEVVVTCH